MRTTRLIAAALGITALAVPTAPGLATAQTEASGTGTASSTQTVLSVLLGGDGGLLAVDVLGDETRSTTQGSPLALSSFAPISVDAAADALDVTVAPVEVSSTGGEQSKGADAVNLSNAAVSGTISPAELTAAVDADGARSLVQSALADLTAGGGLLTLDAVQAGVTANVAGTASEATRGLTVDSLAALDLGALLDGLGLLLSDLPLQDVLDLLAAQGITVPGVGDAADVQTAVNSLNAAIDELQSTSGGTAAPLTETVCTTVDGLLGPLGLPLPPQVTCTTVETVTQTIGETIDALQAQLAALLADVLAALDGAPLVSLNGVNVGLLAKATDSVDTSVADVQAAIGSVTVAGRTLPLPADLTAQLDQVAAVADQVTSTVGGVLGTIHSDLASLVDVDLLERTSSVVQEGESVVANAGLTVARVTITPPATLGQVVASLGAAESIGDVITELGGTVPQLSDAMTALEATLGGTVQALSQPSTVVLGSLTARAAHLPGTAVGAPTAGTPTTPAGELPRTGAAAAATAFTGVMLAGAALGIRRWLRATSQPTS